MNANLTPLDASKDSRTQEKPWRADEMEQRFQIMERKEDQRNDNSSEEHPSKPYEEPLPKAVFEQGSVEDVSTSSSIFRAWKSMDVPITSKPQPPLVSHSSSLCDLGGCSRRRFHDGPRSLSDLKRDDMRLIRRLSIDMGFDTPGRVSPRNVPKQPFPWNDSDMYEFEDDYTPMWAKGMKTETGSCKSLASSMGESAMDSDVNSEDSWPVLADKNVCYEDSWRCGRTPRLHFVPDTIIEEGEEFCE